MKADAITIGALGFAAFAAWAYLGRDKGAKVSGSAGQVYSMLSDQRNQVGAATKQNGGALAALSEWTAWAGNKNRYSLGTGGSNIGLKR